MEIRNYKSEYCNEMAELFYNTVHSVNSSDYSKEELCAWATGNVDIKKWNKRFLESYTLVAFENNIVAGFGNIYNTGYLDMLYVHKDYQKKGIASDLCDRLEKYYNNELITVNASITAKHFFEKRGYRVLEKQFVYRNSVKIINYAMELKIRV